MKVKLNGKRAEFPGKTLGEIMDQIRAHLADTGNVIVGTRLDGKALTGAEIERMSDEPARDSQTLSVETENPACLAERTLAELDKHLPALASASERLCAALSAGNESEGFSTLAATLELWQVIAKALAEIPLLLGISPEDVSVAAGSASDCVVRIADFLGEMKDAVEAKDVVTLSDLVANRAPELIDTTHELIELMRGRAKEA